MGYDSRVYVMQVFTCGSRVHASEIACFDMCVMGREFRDLFTEEIEYSLYFTNTYGEEETNTDFYGDICKFASVKTVRDWLRDEVKRNDYRRLRPLLGFLEGIDKSEWEECELQVVHFGC